MKLSDRVKRIFHYCESKQSLSSIGSILIKNSTDPHIDLTFFYLTGIRSGLFEGCALTARPDGSIRVYSSRLEEQSAIKDRGEFELVVFSGRDELNSLLKKDLSDGISIIGVNASELTHRDYLRIKELLPDVELVDIGPAIQRARMVKDEDEITRIRKAASIASRIYQSIPSELDEGVTEGELAAHISYEMQRAGASGPSFESIVAFGANSAEPHYGGRKARLRLNKLALFDFGARYARYCSDITRTLVFGRASALQKRIYGIVLEANELGISAAKAGAMSGDVHKLVADYIDSTEFKGRFVHSLGHSLGLAIHDGGVMHPSSSVELEEGMVFTIEPGIYLPRMGGVRIEDDIVVRKGKADVLTRATKDLIEV